jgi:cell division protein FtsL
MVEPLPPGHLLVLRPRRPDPTPPARAFPPSRARRSRGRPYISPLLGAVLMVAAALLLVAQSAAATQASYQIATLKQEEARLNAEHDQLQAQLAGDRAATRVALAAQQLGLSHPSRWQFVRATGSPIALGPLPAGEGRTGVWDHVLAVLDALTGRSLQAHPTSRS